MKMEQSVPKRRHINFIRRGITQKKAYKNKRFIQQKTNYDHNETSGLALLCIMSA